jgi:NADH-quinone oxidoreductase subunit F
MAQVKMISKYLETPGCESLPVFEAHGGYSRLRRVVEEKWPVQKIIDTVKASSLRGLGGAGFPTGMKWGFVPRDAEGPKYIAVNADESEPGTFKDRHILMRAPHLLIEGLVIAALAVGADEVFIYIRGEYWEPYRVLKNALEEAKKAGYAGDRILGSEHSVHVTVHRGAGAYICGEETALLTSLEGYKGWPKLKPPFPAVKGLFRRPTLVNNVETLAYIPIVLEIGPEQFAAAGVERNGGARLFGVSGHVNRPGIYECALGTPMREVIYELAGGIRNGKRLKAVIPGGSSCPVLTADEIDVPLDFDSLAKIGSMLGSGGMIVMDEDTDIVKVLYRICQFYSNESCGQCTPCREGTGWMTRIMERINRGDGTSQDLDNLADIAEMIGGNTICPLGDAASLPVMSFIRKFRPEFEARLSRKYVPSGGFAGPEAEGATR